jgi:uncharacterized protein (DUF1330 family)
MAGDAMRRVLVKGLQVADAAMYQRYRDEMRPILERFGGGFGYDFAVSRVLISEADRPINRVFTIWFPDRARADRFFADPDYRAVRRAWFEPSVAAVTDIAAFDEPVPAAPAAIASRAPG